MPDGPHVNWPPALDEGLVHRSGWSNLCHGTTGNGVAFLKLFTRTGDELWLERARRFAVHAAAQVAQARDRYGHGRHSLWTGDVGAAVYLARCLAGTSALPTLDVTAAAASGT